MDRASGEGKVATDWFWFAQAAINIKDVSVM